jgi:hypothetical protein
MRFILLFSILSFTIYFSQAQNSVPVKDSFTFNSIPTYDISGNLYTYSKKYDHLPTKEDTIDFYKEMHDFFRPTMDSVEREVAMQQKRIENMNREYERTHKQKQFAPMYPRVGKHLFSLHWISWEKFGSVDIKKVKTNTFSIKGSQKDNKGNYVTIDGILIPVEKGKLSFSGEIVTKASGNNNGIACEKKGNYTFLCTPGRKYWRLQEMENCEGGFLVDYVDIFF